MALFMLTVYIICVIIMLVFMYCASTVSNDYWQDEPDDYRIKGIRQRHNNRWPRDPDDD